MDAETVNLIKKQAEGKLLTFEGRARLGKYAAAYMKDLVKDGTAPSGVLADVIIAALEAMARPIEVAPLFLRGFSSSPSGDWYRLLLETPSGQFEVQISGKQFEADIRPHLKEG
jgi:hypothetical protein